MTVVFAALAASTLLGAPNASADTPEEQYLALLAKHGITGDPAQLIAAGHDTCWAAGQGWPAIGLAVMKPNAEFSAAGLAWRQVGQARHDAVNTLCPDLSTWKD